MKLQVFFKSSKQIFISRGEILISNFPKLYQNILHELRKAGKSVNLLLTTYKARRTYQIFKTDNRLSESIYVLQTRIFLYHTINEFVSHFLS